MRLVKITPEEYEALRLAGVWVQWAAKGHAPIPAWGVSKLSADRFRGMNYISFWTRVDDEQDASHGDEASTY